MRLKRVLSCHKTSAVSNSMIECRNRSKNVRNRKSVFFYIETVVHFFFQNQKICFLSISKKKFKILDQKNRTAGSFVTAENTDPLPFKKKSAIWFLCGALTVSRSV